MMENIIAALRSRIEDLRCLLDAANLPAEKVQAICAELDRMEQILRAYE